MTETVTNKKKTDQDRLDTLLVQREKIDEKIKKIKADINRKSAEEKEKRTRALIASIEKTGINLDELDPAEVGELLKSKYGN